MAKVSLGTANSSWMIHDKDGKENIDPASGNPGAAAQGKPSIGTAYAAVRLSSGGNTFSVSSNPG